MFHPVIMMSTYTPDKTKQLFQLLSVDVYTPHLSLPSPFLSPRRGTSSSSTSSFPSIHPVIGIRPRRGNASHFSDLYKVPRTSFFRLYFEPGMPIDTIHGELGHRLWSTFSERRKNAIVTCPSSQMTRRSRNCCLTGLRDRFPFVCVSPSIFLPFRSIQHISLHYFNYSRRFSICPSTSARKKKSIDFCNSINETDGSARSDTVERNCHRLCSSFLFRFPSSIVASIHPPFIAVIREPDVSKTFPILLFYFTNYR